MIDYTFGKLTIDDEIYTEDIVIDNGVVKPRQKDRTAVLTGHRPLMITENVPWECTDLVIGTGKYGKMPVDKEIYEEAEKRNVRLCILPTDDCIDILRMYEKGTNFILHLTC